MIYFVGDTHFGHERIIEYEKRPFPSVEEMDRLLILNWNQKVKPDDLVYHLGDFGIHKKERMREIMEQLNGTKILIRGNHDLNPTAMRSLGFVASIESAYIKIGQHEAYLSHEPFNVSAPNVWQLHGHVHSAWKIRSVERKICVSVENWNYAPIPESELISVMDRVTNPWSHQNAMEAREEEDQGPEGSEQESEAAN